MSVVLVLLAARKAGANVFIRDGKLVVQSQGRLPAAVMAQLQAQRDHLVEMLSLPTEEQQARCCSPCGRPQHTPDVICGREPDPGFPIARGWPGLDAACAAIEAGIAPGDRCSTGGSSVSTVVARPFDERLAIAREILRYAPDAVSHIPAHDRDQLQAAADETRVFAQVARNFLTASQPERGWRLLERANPLPDQHAYLLAALLDISSCSHLRKGGPQPAFGSLPLRRIDCQQCVQTRRTPPPEDGDRCDVCGTRGIDFFIPFSCATGPVLVSGDACSRCAVALLPADAAA